MNTKIGTSFGLALLMLIGVFAAMFAMGSFTPKQASAAGVAEIAVDVTPATAKSIGQYTIAVSGGAGGLAEIPVGGTITVTFGSKFTVPSSIATSAVKLKATVVSGGSGSPVAGRLNNAETVTVDGRAITITVPDMDKTAGTGDQAIGASTGLVGGTFTVTLTQAAGIESPEVAQASIVPGSSAGARKGTLTVNTSTSGTTTATTAATITDFTSFTKFTPTSGKRGATITVTGGGFAKSCDDCKVRLNPQNATAPTTGSGGVAFNGSGTINADGEFAGTIVLGANTKAGGYVWITDGSGGTQVSASSLSQSPSAVPSSTSSKPGSTVSVTLTDYPAASNFTADTDANGVVDDYVTVGGVTAVNTAKTFTALQTATTSLALFKFKVPSTVGVGTHKVVVATASPSAGTANFMLTVGLREITVTPATAAPGQAITVSGTGFGTTGQTIAAGALTMTAGSVTTAASVNPSDIISIDNSGAWNYATTFPTLNATSCSSCAADVVFTATDNSATPLVGVSDTAFSRTLRTISVSPTTISPGGALTVTVGGFSVDHLSSTTGATFSVQVSTATGSGYYTLVGTYTFPLGSDGTGVGTVTLPTTADNGTRYVTVTDNAGTIHLTAPQGANAANNSKQISIKIPKGTVSASPTAASTGQQVTLTGTGYPPNTSATILTFGTATAMPSGGITSDASGAFEAVIEVPAKTTGGSLNPGTSVIEVTIGSITGTTTTFSVPNPSITLSAASASVEDTITVTGEGFNSLGTVTTLDIGTASALPSPAPRANRSGEITADIQIPLLNPGTYTLTMANASSGFSASTTFIALAAKVVAASTADNTEVIFADVIANDDSLVRVWRFSNADQSWNFFDPRPAFSSANTLAKTGAGDIVWVNVTVEQTFQDGTLFPGWNLISLK